MSDLGAGVFREPLVQPDQRSCGAAVLVAARLVLDPAYAASAATPTRFREEVLRMHARVTGAVTAAGRLQVPWPRALGTPPWALAHQLSATSGPGRPAARHRTRLVRAGGAELYDDLVSATSGHRPVAVYVGNAWLPRHVVLCLGEVGSGLRCYEPAGGGLVDVTRAAFATHRLGLAGWDRAWFVVGP